MFSKATQDKVIVRVKKTHNDTSTILGADGREIELWYNPDFNKLEHVNICAEVVAVPDKFSNAPVETIYKSTPVAREPNGGHCEVQEFIDLADTPIDIKVGDNVYFHYLGIGQHSYLDIDS